MTTFYCPQRGRIDVEYHSINDDDMYIYDIFSDTIMKNLGKNYQRFDEVTVRPGQTAMKGLSLKAFLWTYKRVQGQVQEEPAV